jgi:hypothetical protein
MAAGMMAGAADVAARPRIALARAAAPAAVLAACCLAVRLPVARRLLVRHPAARCLAAWPLAVAVNSCQAQAPGPARRAAQESSGEAVPASARQIARGGCRPAALGDSRPAARLDSRPAAQLGSRPAVRLGSRQAAQQSSRPAGQASSVQPVSGRQAGQIPPSSARRALRISPSISSPPATAQVPARVLVRSQPPLASWWPASAALFRSDCEGLSGLAGRSRAPIALSSRQSA